ncbi:MAG TPA: hypothetical protein VE152_01345 [Acidimicrobiales bacterium]|nr:hypothetical protein [Acidimicrobiales bacterium]
MKAALVVSWTTPKTGRENKAIDYGREVDKVWSRYAAEGRCSEPEWFWASRGHSLWIVKAEYEELLALLAETYSLIVKGQLLVDDFEYDIHICGREEMMAPYEAVVSEVLA